MKKQNPNYFYCQIHDQHYDVGGECPDCLRKKLFLYKSDLVNAYYNLEDSEEMKTLLGMLDYAITKHGEADMDSEEEIYWQGRKDAMRSVIALLKNKPELADLNQTTVWAHKMRSKAFITIFVICLVAVLIKEFLKGLIGVDNDLFVPDFVVGWVCANLYYRRRNI